MGEDKLHKGKLLEAWEPTETAGEAVGCIATSFTFDSGFFEDNCLSRFISMESDIEEDGVAYMLEREEKLQSLKCALTLVDQHNCQGTRSLRWDLLPVGLKKGIMHSKISLLCWENMVRLIIASANLTRDGYRNNREVFGVIDYYPGCNVDKSALDDTISQLKKMLESNNTKPNAPVVRANDFFKEVSQKVKDWTKGAEGDREIDLQVIHTGFESDSVFDQLVKLWPSSTPPSDAFVISPFFDKVKKDESYKPAEALWEIMKKRGEAYVYYDLDAEYIENDKRVIIKAPETIGSTKPQKESAKIFLRRLTDDLDRPLHLKSIWLEDEKNILYMIGSSNFTSAGTGIGKTQNAESNLVYIMKNVSTKLEGMMNDCYYNIADIDEKTKKQWSDKQENLDEETNEMVLLPDEFKEAIFDIDKSGKRFIKLKIDGNPPQEWKLYNEDEKIYCQEDWVKGGEQKEVDIYWGKETEPSGFGVEWEGSNGRAWLPINIMNGSVLMPPEKLRNLPLDILVQIMASVKPYYKVIAEAERKKQIKNDTETISAELDPLKRNDSAEVLLKRTREISWALSQMRQRLENPFPTEESLEWRLRGPVGVIALKNAILKDVKNSVERDFLLVEIILELNRVKPKQEQNSITPERIRAQINLLIEEMKDDLKTVNVEDNNLRGYINRVLGEIK